MKKKKTNQYFSVKWKCRSTPQHPIAPRQRRAEQWTLKTQCHSESSCSPRASGTLVGWKSSHCSRPLGTQHKGRPTFLSIPRERTNNKWYSNGMCLLNGCCRTLFVTLIRCMSSRFNLFHFAVSVHKMFELNSVSQQNEKFNQQWNFIWLPTKKKDGKKEEKTYEETNKRIGQKSQ